jgi:hypothetical protein
LSIVDSCNVFIPDNWNISIVDKCFHC